MTMTTTERTTVTGYYMETPEGFKPLFIEAGFMGYQIGVELTSTDAIYLERYNSPDIYMTDINEKGLAITFQTIAKAREIAQEIASHFCEICAEGKHHVH